MLTGEYQFHCQFNSSAILPAFKGSMLRGSFGHALKGVTCALRRRSCDNCLLSATCVYAFIFETSQPPPVDDLAKARIAARPHPYVLIPPLDETRSYAAGDSLLFGLTLFGRANDYLPHIVYAVEQMGETGMGRGRGSDQGKFILNTIVAEGRTIYDGSRKLLAKDQPPPDLRLTAPPAGPTQSLNVTLLTPLRLKEHNQLQDRLPFELLIRAALRRISTLENAYGAGEPTLDYRGLIQQAGQVAISRSTCRWQDLTRYSSRQQTAMLIGGLQGSITYEGKLTEFVPLLRYCEKTGLGKQTAFGLGRIEVET